MAKTMIELVLLQLTAYLRNLVIHCFKKKKNWVTWQTLSTLAVQPLIFLLPRSGRWLKSSLLIHPLLIRMAQVALQWLTPNWSPPSNSSSHSFIP